MGSCASLLAGHDSPPEIGAFAPQALDHGRVGTSSNIYKSVAAFCVFEDSTSEASLLVFAGNHTAAQALTEGPAIDPVILELNGVFCLLAPPIFLNIWTEFVPQATQQTPRDRGALPKWARKKPGNTLL